MNELEQLESYQDISYAKLSTEDTLHFMKYGSKPLESDKLKSSYVLPTRYFNNSRSQKASYIGHSRRYNETTDKTPKTHRREGSNTGSTPHESERLSDLRKSTNISIRKTIDEIERQLINRKSITPNKSLIDINDRPVLNINSSFMDTDGAEDRPTDNFESPKSMFTDLKGFESFRKDSDDCVKIGTDFRSPMFGFSKKFVFSDYKVARQDSVCITVNSSGLGTGRNLEEEYFLMVICIQLTVAIKMNSDYMQHVMFLSGEELYKTALRENIPFFKVKYIQWHIWIESMLYNQYLKLRNL